MAFCIAVLGAILQGSVGFGLGLLGVPLLVLIDPVFIPGPLLLLAAFLLNLLISRRERMSIDFASVRWAVPGRILGAVLGAGLLALIPQCWDFFRLYGYNLRHRGCSDGTGFSETKGIKD